jgi:hypothetical protein
MYVTSPTLERQASTSNAEIENIEMLYKLVIQTTAFWTIYKKIHLRDRLGKSSIFG